MKKSLKQAVLRGITLLIVTQTGYVLAAPTEGVEFSIRWDAANSVYRVYVRPIATPTPDLTMSAQITIRVPHAAAPEQFTIPKSSITSAHTNVSWSYSSTAPAPPENPSFDYFSFTPVISNQQAFGWQAGIEQEVFNFKNTGKCLGAVTIINNETDPLVGGISSNLNAGNEFSSLSWSAVNDYVGNYGTAADCTSSANTAPKAIADSATVVSGAAVTIDVLANDTDADGDTLTLKSATDGDFGSVVIQNGKLIISSL